MLVRSSRVEGVAFSVRSVYRCDDHFIGAHLAEDGDNFNTGGTLLAITNRVQAGKSVALYIEDGRALPFMEH